MRTQHLQVDVSKVQTAICGVALCLDALLVNGIQYGVLHSAVFPGFLEKTSGNLLRALETLQVQLSPALVGSESKATEILASLTTRCHELIDLVGRLRSFRTLPAPQMGTAVSQIPPRREKCVQLIQELEDCFRTPKPFYQTRPSDLTATVAEFLTNLERTFAEAWAAANIGGARKGHALKRACHARLFDQAQLRRLSVEWHQKLAAHLRASSRQPHGHALAHEHGGSPEGSRVRLTSGWWRGERLQKQFHLFALFRG